MNSERPSLVFLNGIGDHFINLPAIRAIATMFPGRLRIICRAGAEPLFSDVPAESIQEIHWGLDQRDQVLASPQVLALLDSCDLLVSLNPWHTEAVDRMLNAVRPQQSVGFFAAFRTHVPLDFSKHSSELAFDIARALGNTPPIDQFSVPPTLPASATTYAVEVRRLLPVGSRILAIHPETLEEKMWDLEKFREFLDGFLERNQNFFALIVSLNDLSLDKVRNKDRVISCHGLPFFASAAIVAGADFFVGVDSCMLHVADIFRVPGVGLFGPTNPAEFGFRLTTSRHIWAKGSTQAIGVSDVIECVDELQRVLQQNESMP